MAWQNSVNKGSAVFSISDDPAQVLYLRQVFQYLLLGLLTAAAGTQVGMMPFFLNILVSSPFMGLLVVIGLVIWAGKASTGPRAGLIYYIFTFAMGMIVAPTIYLTLHKFNGLQILMQAGILTILDVTAFGAYAWVSKRNFNFMGGFLVTGLITMILAQLMNMFWLHSSGMSLMMAIVTVLLFNGFILYDVSRMLNAERRDPPTLMALNLFLDVFNIFMAMLRILDRD